MWFSFHSGYDRDYYGGGRGEFDSEPSARMSRNAHDATKQHSFVFVDIGYYGGGGYGGGRYRDGGLYW
jgi:hypothetical protein